MDSNVFNDVWQFALRLYVLNGLMDQNIFDNFLPVGSRADVYKFWWRSSDKRSIGGVQKICCSDRCEQSSPLYSADLIYQGF